MSRRKKEVAPPPFQRPRPMAWFDEDGLCSGISEFDMSHAGRCGGEPPAGARPDDIWLDRKTVRQSTPCALVIPEVVDVGQKVIIKLPRRVVAIVDGERQRERLVIEPLAPGPIRVDIRGAQKGEFVVQARTYAEHRHAAYPDNAEQNGAFAKALLALARGETVPADALDVLEQIAAVKAAHPKPE